MATLEQEINTLQLLQGTKFLRAYLECSDEVQTGIRELLNVLNDPETDDDDRESTLMTLADALFPNPHEGKLGMDLEQSERLGAAHSDEMREALEELDREEQTFADRLRSLMDARDLNQQALAKMLGVGQPAISNMLNRQCRPQRRTVVHIAEALGVTPEKLWPGFASSSEDA
jgi:plasmid maintenance system antidote protein VapI